MATIKVDSTKPVASDRQANLMVVSFRHMRLIVGLPGISIGFVLPLTTALFTGCCHFLESIRHYYYTIAGDVFVGLLCAVAFFMILYPGKGKWEDIWTNMAGFALWQLHSFLPDTVNKMIIVPGIPLNIRNGFQPTI